MCVVSLGSLRNLDDPALPTLREALNPSIAAAALAERLPLDGACARLRWIRMTAYKPGRRCLIEYEFEVASPDYGVRTLFVLGKLRAHRYGNAGYRQLRAVWDAGFCEGSADGISVPEPLGTVPVLRMWLQRKAPGRLAADLMHGPDGVAMAGRIAAAVQKLHMAAIPASRRHTIGDEIRILERCLKAVSDSRPELAGRAVRLADACARLGGMLPAPLACGSHRDFYADQVLVSKDRLFLIDFDLFCEADPGLDIGNFLGHVTEQALRVHGDARTLAPFERALEDDFVALAGERTRWPVRVYAALTLARHVYLSTRFADRSHATPALLALAEERVRALAAEGGHA